jgi:hypothetical protein
MNFFVGVNRLIVKGRKMLLSQMSRCNPCNFMAKGNQIADEIEIVCQFTIKYGDVLK